MKAVTVKELKEELTYRSPNELRELCLRLSKFKKENKELLTYLLFEASDETKYIEEVKREVDEEFKLINKKSQYLIKKGLRKILRNVRKYNRYSLKKETEVELLIYYCSKLKKFTPSINRNTGLQNLYLSQVASIRKKLSVLHEDRQSDYEQGLRELMT
jgi:peptide subunit release factor 1 (eRF1)